MSNPIGFNSVGLHQYPIERVIEKVAEAGYDAVEFNAEVLPWAKPHVTPDFSFEKKKHIRKKAQDAGIAISSVSAHVNLVNTDPMKRKANLQYAKGCIDLGGDSGTTVAHLLSGEPPKGIPRQEALKWLTDGVAQCVERGKSVGVRVAFEPVANHLVCDSAGMLELMDALKPLHLFVNFDPSHLWVHGDDVPAAIRTFGNRIIHVHIKDAKGTADNYQFPPLGRGDGDFEGFIQALKDIGYNGVLSIEYEANAFGYQETEQEIIEGSLQFVRQMIS